MRVAIGRRPPRFPACGGAGSGTGGAGAAGRGAARGEYLAEPPSHPAGRRAAGARPGRELKRDRFNARFDDVRSTNEAAALPGAWRGETPARSPPGGAPGGMLAPADGRLQRFGSACARRALGAG